MDQNPKKQVYSLRKHRTSRHPHEGGVQFVAVSGFRLHGNDELLLNQCFPKLVEKNTIEIQIQSYFRPCRPGNGLKVQNKSYWRLPNPLLKTYSLIRESL